MVVAHQPRVLSTYEPHPDVRAAEPKFWAHVEKLFSDNATSTKPCWLWRGPVRRDGTALIRTTHRDYPVHTLAWLLRAPLEDRDLVPRPQYCEERYCVRFEHLALMPKRHGTGTMTPARKQAIYLLYHPITHWVRPMSQEAIAQRFNITQRYVSDILREEERRIDREGLRDYR